MRCGKRRWRRSRGWWISSSTATSDPAGCRAAPTGEAGQHARSCQPALSAQRKVYSLLACFRFQRLLLQSRFRQAHARAQARIPGGLPDVAGPAWGVAPCGAGGRAPGAPKTQSAAESGGAREGALRPRAPGAARALGGGVAPRESDPYPQRAAARSPSGWAAMYAEALSGLVEKPRDLSADAPGAEATKDHILREWELVQHAQTLEESALADLYSTYYPRAYNYAFLQLGDIQAAEDLASEVMLKVLESIRNYRFRGTPFAAWVFRIARTRLIDLHRRRKRRGEVDLTEPLATTQISPEVLAERALDRGQLHLALKYLTDEQRQGIVLKFIEGFDNASTAGIRRPREGAGKAL